MRKRAYTLLISVFLLLLTFIKADIASQRPRKERWNRAYSFAWCSLSCFPGWLRTICILSRPHNFWLLKKDTWVLPKRHETFAQCGVAWRMWEMWRFVYFDFPLLTHRDVSWEGSKGTELAFTSNLILDSNYLYVLDSGNIEEVSSGFVSLC